jgi:hypothetical protein
MLQSGKNGNLMDPLAIDERLTWFRTTMWPWERKAYTDAVNCLMSKPSRILTTDPSLAPGAKTRYALPCRNYAGTRVLIC